ncbi:MAG TPA: hypothetical protein VGX03_22265 [Candidatus Binatia bacterium]|jgi:uncharacterized protein YmfQ (DUF2313 family)|nr:hypothetical protein [Candidatus Binatia bacterium]
MQTFLKRAKWAVFAGALALAVPATAGAAMTESGEHWNQGQAELQKNLPPGQPADVYRRKLEELGYKITSTNYDNPDYLEYEVVKGAQTWEVQIDVDEDTHRANKVDIAHNIYKTDATKAELERNSRMAANEPTDDESRHATARQYNEYSDRDRARYSESRRPAATRNNEYSDRDRVSTDQLVKELESLPTGRDKQFYKAALRKRGYDIARVDKDTADELKLEAVKDGRSVKMDVAFDEDTGKSTKVDASSLWMESESTSRTRRAQTGDTSRTVPEHRTSDMERQSRTETHRSR